jgi:hypothetical protein
MLSTWEIILNSCVVVLLLPLAVQSLITRRLPPERSFLGKLYRADPYLPIVNDIFLIALSCTCMGRLALHFGLIDLSRKSTVDTVTAAPFIVLLFLFFGFLIRAGIRLRRARGPET